MFDSSDSAPVTTTSPVRPAPWPTTMPELAVAAPLGSSEPAFSTTSLPLPNAPTVSWFVVWLHLPSTRNAHPTQRPPRLFNVAPAGPRLFTPANDHVAPRTFQSGGGRNVDYKVDFTLVKQICDVWLSVRLADFVDNLNVLDVFSDKNSAVCSVASILNPSCFRIAIVCSIFSLFSAPPIVIMRSLFCQIISNRNQPFCKCIVKSCHQNMQPLRSIAFLRNTISAPSRSA